MIIEYVPHGHTPMRPPSNHQRTDRWSQRYRYFANWKEPAKLVKPVSPFKIQIRRIIQCLRKS